MCLLVFRWRPTLCYLVSVTKSVNIQKYTFRRYPFLSRPLSKTLSSSSSSKVVNVMMIQMAKRYNTYLLNVLHVNLFLSFSSCHSFGFLLFFTHSCVPLALVFSTIALFADNRLNRVPLRWANQSIVSVADLRPVPDHPLTFILFV